MGLGLKFNRKPEIDCPSCQTGSRVYALKSCVGCCARLIANARPDKEQQKMHMDYLLKYYAHEKADILALVREIKNAP